MGAAAAAATKRVHRMSQAGLFAGVREAIPVEMLMERALEKWLHGRGS